MGGLCAKDAAQEPLLLEKSVSRHDNGYTTITVDQSTDETKPLSRTDSNESSESSDSALSSPGSEHGEVKADDALDNEKPSRPTLTNLAPPSQPQAPRQSFLARITFRKTATAHPNASGAAARATSPPRRKPPLPPSEQQRNLTRSIFNRPMAMDAAWKWAQHKDHPLHLALVKYTFHCSQCGEASRGAVYRCKTCENASTAAQMTEKRITVCAFCWANATGHGILEDEPQALGSVCTLHRHPMRFLKDSKYKCSKCSTTGESYVCEYPKCSYMLCKACFRDHRTPCKAKGCQSPSARGLYCMLHQFKQDVVVPKSRQRVDVMLELAATEDSYCKALQNAVRTMRRFGNLIEMKQPLLTQEQLELIFRNLPDVCKLSEAMCASFQQLKDCGVLFAHTATSFLHFVELLPEPYLVYLKGQERGLEGLADARTKLKQLKYFLAEGSGELDLESILIMPLQRLPRYSLLFGELLKATPAGSPQYADIAECKARVDKIASDINTALQRRHKEQTLTELAQQFDGLLIQLASPDRHMIKRGMLRRRDMDSGSKSPRSHRSKGKFREIHVFLFNDILLYATAHGKRFRFKNSFPVCDMEVDAIAAPPQMQMGGSGVTTRMTLASASEAGLAFRPTVADLTSVGSFAGTDESKLLTGIDSSGSGGKAGGAEKVHTGYAFFIKVGDVDYSMFLCETEEERRDWLTKLSGALQAASNRPVSNSLVLASPDSMVSPPTITHGVAHTSAASGGGGGGTHTHAHAHSHTHQVHAIAQPSGDSGVMVSDFSVIARTPALATTKAT